MCPEIRFTPRLRRPGTGSPSSSPEKDLPVVHDLNPDMTFETFVHAESNAFARFSCLEIADRSPQSYNPLFLFSDKSAGKTHLLHAVGNRMLHENGRQRIRYVHADRFTTDFSQSLRLHRIRAFRDAYNGLDVLLFDDAHRLEGRLKTQEECTVLFDTLLREGKTLVVSGRVAPFRLPDLSPRLKSILSWGLIAEIQPPETETRIRAVKDRVCCGASPLPDDIIFFLAKSNDDMKHLFRNVARLQTYASLNGGKLSLSTIRSLIRDQTKKELQMEDIQAITAGYFKISVSDLSSERRPRAISYPRQMAMYLCRKHTSHSLKKIGAAFSKRDHSTVVYAVRRIEQELNRNPEARQDLENLETLLL